MRLRILGLAAARVVLGVGVAVTLCSPAHGTQLGRWGLSAGVIDFSRQNEAVELGFDVRFAPLRWGLVPHGGVHVTADESFYGYGGLRRPFFVTNTRWLVEPSFAVSLYENGDGKELGGVVEFRSGLDVLLQTDRAGWIGLGFYHLSNSSIYDLNPGTNSLLLRWILPGGSGRSADDGR